MLGGPEVVVDLPEPPWKRLLRKSRPWLRVGGTLLGLPVPVAVLMVSPSTRGFTIAEIVAAIGITMTTTWLVVGLVLGDQRKSMLWRIVLGVPVGVLLIYLLYCGWHVFIELLGGLGHVH